MRRDLGNIGHGSRERTLSAVTKSTVRQTLQSPTKRSFGSSRRRRRRDRRRRYKGKSHKKSHHHSFDFDSTEEEREPILDIFGKGTRNNFKRETQTDSNSTSTSESTESVDSSESSGNSSTESSPSSESSDSTSSDDNLTTNTTTVERGLFGKSKKKGGPKQHPLKRASFSRMWRRVEFTDESSGSTSSDDNLTTNTTTVERGLFGKSKKKGGPKQHPLKRASFSRMWRRVESTDESSGSTSPDDNLTTNATTVERGLFGKSKKKGGPKKHPLKRASFSKMWRRGESTDSNSTLNIRIN